MSFVGNDERAYLRDIEKLTGVQLTRVVPPEGTALDLTQREDPGPHTMQSRGRGGGGSQGGRSQGKPRGFSGERSSACGSPRGGGSGYGKPSRSGGGGPAGGGRKKAPGAGGHRKGAGKSRSWSPVS